MTIAPTTPLILDSNEYIFGISGNKTSCAQLIDRLDILRIFIPIIIVREVQRNLKNMYGLDNVFFQLISNRPNITLVWSPPPEKTLLTYIAHGFPAEDAVIAATAEHIGAEYVISENRHFLQQSTPLPFEIVNAEQMLKLLP